MNMRIAILGAAHGHATMYCQRWQSMPGVSLIGVWDHDTERREAFARSFGIVAFPDLAGALRRTDVDAVVVAAETSQHADVAVRALRAGKPVVLQKPLALTMRQADRIVTAVEETQVPFTLAWQMRVDPQNLEMKRLIDDGTLGRIFMIRRRHGLDVRNMAGFEHSWHVDPRLNRGMWADDAAHPIDFLYWILGLPSSVIAEIDTLNDPLVPDDNGIAVYRYPDGTIAEVVSSFVCAAGENTTEIVGENGVVVQNYGDVPSCSAPREAGAPGLRWLLRGTTDWVRSDIPSPQSHAERITGLAVPLIDFLTGRRAAIASAHEGRDVLRMVLASYRAAASGRRVSLGA